MAGNDFSPKSYGNTPNWKPGRERENRLNACFFGVASPTRLMSVFSRNCICLVRVIVIFYIVMSVEDLKKYFEEQFSSIKQTVASLKAPSIRPETPVRLKSDGNQAQLNHEKSVLLEVKIAEEHLGAGDTDSASQHLKAARVAIEKRIKLIQLVDQSENGWAFAKEYEANSLASDSDDEKKIKKAESEASKKRKAKQEEAAKKRARYGDQPSTSGRQFFRGGNRKSFQYNDRCFRCGGQGHWKIHCESGDKSKPAPAAAAKKE